MEAKDYSAEAWSKHFALRPSSPCSHSLAAHPLGEAIAGTDWDIGHLGLLPALKQC